MDLRLFKAHTLSQDLLDYVLIQRFQTDMHSDREPNPPPPEQKQITTHKTDSHDNLTNQRRKKLINRSVRTFLFPRTTVARCAGLRVRFEEDIFFGA